jgi:hypothetical protein
LIFSIDYSSYSCYRYCKDYPQYTSEICPGDHDDKYKKRGYIESLTHDVGYEYIILESLDDEIEYDYSESDFP